MEVSKYKHIGETGRLLQLTGTFKSPVNLNRDKSRQQHSPLKLRKTNQLTTLIRNALQYLMAINAQVVMCTLETSGYIF